MITVNNRCNCWKPLSIRQAVNALIDETREFVAEPSFDEFDDVKVCWNRLVGRAYSFNLSIFGGHNA